MRGGRPNGTRGDQSLKRDESKFITSPFIPSTHCFDARRGERKGPAYLKSFVDMMKKQFGINVFVLASWEKSDGSVTTGV
jgi:hypothetical protein